MKLVIGTDIGNFDTKTQHTSTPSSYKCYDTPNLMIEEYVKYKGLFYAPTNERNNQQQDKTANGYCLIMTLFAIAKETIFQLRQKYPGISNEDIQKEINKYDEVALGIGLPAGYYSSLAQKTVDYYNENWANGFEFDYMNFHFKLKLVNCAAFPQDFTAVAYNKNVKTVEQFSDYYIIGIGGGTVDIIPVKDSNPQVDKCRTIEKGTTIMYEEIIKTIQQETGNTMEYSTIEKILLNKPSVVDERRKERVKRVAADFANKLVDDFAHTGLRLADNPCVFIGGGALMMKPTLEANPAFVMTEFVEDVHANAVFYAEFI